MIRARLDDVEDRWRRIQRPQRHWTLPTPAPAAVATAIIIVEIRAGLRPAHQLERLSHYSLWPVWADLAEHPADRPVPVAPRPLAVTLRELVPGLVDATVVIDFAGRTHALGLRLDGAPGFWQLVELDYPTELAAPAPRPRDKPLPVVPRGERDAPLPQDPQRRLLPEAAGQSPYGDLHPTRELGEGPGIELE